LVIDDAARNRQARDAAIHVEQFDIDAPGVVLLAARNGHQLDARAAELHPFCRRFASFRFLRDAHKHAAVADLILTELTEELDILFASLTRLLGGGRFLFIDD
jgi:hypothetical protein